MKTKLLFFFAIIIIHISFGQEIIRKGTHQQHEEEFGKQRKVTASVKIKNTPIIPLQARTTTGLNKIVFGFLPYWEYNSGANANMHYDLLSHVALFSFDADGSGNISTPSGWPWTDVINSAHSNNTKVIMVVKNFSSTQIHTLLTNTTAKNNLFNNIKNLINNNQLDGVNIDFESLSSSDRGSLLNTFLTDLTTYIHTNLPGKEVSFDGPAVNWSGWDLNGLANSVDYVFIMAYDYNGSWSTTTGAVAPLIHPSGGICVSKSLDNDYATAITNHADKLILGVPYYGKHWKTATDVAGSSITSYVGSTFYKNTVTEANDHGGALWNANYQTSWYKWFQAGSWNQVWADTEQATAAKFDKAISKNLAGVGMWALNYDAGRSELWNLIDSKFNTLGVDNFFTANNVGLYPNPTSGNLQISNPKQIQITSYKIYTPSGKKLKTTLINKNHIDISFLKNGLYFIQLSDEKGNTTAYKIIKN